MLGAVAVHVLFLLCTVPMTLLGISLLRHYRDGFETIMLGAISLALGLGGALLMLIGLLQILNR